jgi:hypothetical protein
MKTLLRLSAVLVAMGNLYALTSREPPLEFSAHSWSELPRLLITAIPALLIAEILIRWMRSLLEAGFFVRYALVAGAVCVGGIMYGALLPSAILLDGSFSVPERIVLLLGAGSVGAVIGGAMGLAEGLIVGLPLAILLGLFRRADQQQPS